MQFFPLPGLCALSAAASQHERFLALSDCLASNSVPALTVTSANYSSAIEPFNLRTPWYPSALAIPANAKQVSAAVKCATKYDLKVAALSGGHSYAAYGLGGANGSLVVDMKQFTKLEVDDASGIAKIGPGMRLGNIALGLYAKGERALPHGLCPGVGIGGHALHGGFGFASRMWGLTLDTIVSMEVVLANGSITEVTKSSNPDLFWALRGAGDSFGIVTEFRMQTVPAPSNGVLWNYTFPSATSIVSKIAILTAAQNFALTAPPEIGLRILFVISSVGLTADFQIYGSYWGSRDDFDSVIAPLLQEWPEDTVGVVANRDWLDALISFNNGGSLEEPADYNQHAVFYAKSIMTPDPITNASWSSFISYLYSPQATSEAPVEWLAEIDLYGGRHSKIASFSTEDAAYAARDTLWTFQLYSVSDLTGSVPYPKHGFAFVDKMSESITAPMPDTRFMAYPNYVDDAYTPEEAHRRYFGKQYQRLKEIKRKVDPKMRFWNPQAVGVGEGFWG